MFSKLVIIGATYVAAVQACTGASGMPNPVTQPSQDPSTWPTIGQPYTVKWNNYAQESATGTLSLYSGCPNNCKEITDIGPGIQLASGTLQWTPSTTLTPGGDYGILFINENPCLTAWNYFGLNAVGTPVGSGTNNTAGGASSAAAPAASSKAASSPAVAASSAAAGSSVPAAAAQPSVITSFTTSWTTVVVTGSPPGTTSAAAGAAAVAPSAAVEIVTVYDTVTVYGPPPSASAT